MVRFTHRSHVLEGNPWNDPVERELSVYLPAGYSDGETPYVSLWDLAAYTNAGPGHLNWRNHGENLAERLDRLIGSGEMDPAIVVIPDCYTSLGGNQYVNSPSVGRYADYIADELVPFVERELNVVPGGAARALFGKSSGGYGALYLAMTQPGCWGAVASHAGDVGFELLFKGAFPTVCQALGPLDADAGAFIRSFWRKNRPSGRDFTVMMILAMAASYDPDPDDPARIRLPFDVRTCTVDPARWARWEAFDPLTLVEARADALKRLHGLYIDVGIYDQYHIQYGTRRFTDRLAELGVAHRYEEFEGTHSSIDWRLDTSLPFLVDTLKNAVAEAN